MRFTDSDTKPWLPVSSDYVNTNVEKEKQNKKSMLTMMSELLQLRQGSAALLSGKYQSHDVSGGKNVFAYTRESAEERYLIVHNFDGKAVSLDFGMAFANVHGRVVLDSRCGGAEASGCTGGGAKFTDFSSLRMAGSQSLVIYLAENDSGGYGPAIVLLLIGVMALVGMYIFKDRLRQGDRRMSMNRGDVELNFTPLEGESRE